MTCPRGTDLVLDLAGARGPDDGDLSAAGAFGNLPCGEGFVSPLAGEGTLLAATLAGLGLPDAPVELTVAAAGSPARGSGASAGRPLDAAGEQGATSPSSAWAPTSARG